MLVKYSRAFVVMLDGFGTLDGAFETITLVQCNNLPRFPIVAMGSKIWGQMREFVRGALINEETIGSKVLELLHVTASAQEALRYIEEGATRLAHSTSVVD